MGSLRNTLLSILSLVLLTAACGHDDSALTSGSCTLSPSYLTKVVGVTPPAVSSTTGIANSPSNGNTNGILPSNGDKSDGGSEVIPSNSNPNNTSSVFAATAEDDGDDRALVDGGSFDQLTYQAAFTSECVQLVEDRSGSFYYRIDASAEPSVGYLSTADLGEGRSETFYSSGVGGVASTHDFSSGAITVERSFKNLTAQNQSQGQWILPWNEPPQYVSVTFFFPTGSDAKLYPTKVTLSMKALDE